jgi:hypothetical protein
MTLNRIAARVLLRILISRCPPHFLPFLPCVKRSEMQIHIANCKKILWSICGCSKETTPSLFVIYLSEIYYLDFKLFIICVYEQ